MERPQYEPTSTNGAPGTAAAAAERRLVERVALVRRHEAGGRQRGAAPEAGVHYQVSQWMIVSGSGRAAGLKSVPTV